MSRAFRNKLEHAEQMPPHHLTPPGRFEKRHGFQEFFVLGCFTSGYSQTCCVGPRTSWGAKNRIPYYFVLVNILYEFLGFGNVSYRKLYGREIAG